MQIESESIVIYLLLALIAVLTAWILYLEKRLAAVFRGHQVKSLESLLAEIGQTVDDITAKSEHDDKLFEDIYRRLRHTLQKTATVRFNPFADQGGNQSFASVFMDENGNGLVLSGLHARDKVSVYAKPLIKYSSEHELSKEELMAIKKARSEGGQTQKTS